MSFSLQTIVPWGRSFAEYLAMFALTEADLQRTILGCADGPASFNAELTRHSGQIVSIDPLYQFSTEEIRQRINETREEVLKQTRLNTDDFVWEQIPSITILEEIRLTAMNDFLTDFQTGLNSGRYLDASLPKLPFVDNSFELALCSHFLFLYSEQLDLDFHLQALNELCRVADEVRIFPLLEFGTTPSRHLQQVTTRLAENGVRAEIQTVDYEFQRGGNKMLRLQGLNSPSK